MSLNFSHNFSYLFKKIEVVKGDETETRESVQRESIIEWKDVLYMIAHDMKNPVSSAGGFLSRLLSGKYGSFTDRQLDYLELVRDNLGKLDRLIKHLLDFLRFESKEYKLILNPVNISILLFKNIEIMRLEADKKDIKIIFNEQKNIEAVVNADSVLINRAIINILENAVKYTKHGGTITVKLSDIGDKLLIQINDTGIGIPENHLPYIFNAFYRGMRDSNGSGLGLFIVKSIIEAHGGEIWVESIPDKGSCFSFTIPKEVKCKSIFSN